MGIPCSEFCKCDGCLNCQASEETQMTSFIKDCEAKKSNELYSIVKGNLIKRATSIISQMSTHKSIPILEQNNELYSSSPETKLPQKEQLTNNLNSEKKLIEKFETSKNCKTEESKSPEYLAALSLAKQKMKRSEEMFKSLEELCGKSISSKTFSLKTNETHELFNDVNDFSELERILERYLQFKRENSSLEKEEKPIRKILKELRARNSKHKARPISLLNKRSNFDCLLDSSNLTEKTNSILNQDSLIGRKGVEDTPYKAFLKISTDQFTNKKSQKSQEKTTEKTTRKRIKVSNPLTFSNHKSLKMNPPLDPHTEITSQNFMSHFFKCLEAEKGNFMNDSEIFKGPLTSNFPIFQFKSKNVSRTNKKSIKQVLDLGESQLQGFNSISNSSNLMNTGKIFSSPFNNLVCARERDEDLLEDLFQDS